MFNVTERQAGDVTILDLEGNIIMGGASARLRDEVNRLHNAGRKNILLNFADVKYIDSSGLGEIVASSAAFGGDIGSIKLMRLPRKVEEVFALGNLLPLFEIFDDEKKALESFRGA